MTVFGIIDDIHSKDNSVMDIYTDESSPDTQLETKPTETELF
jgi:hypothetical protein